MEKSFINGHINELTTNEHIKEFSSLDPSIQELINAAIKARSFSYSPYSNFAVGSAIRTENGLIFTGCNVENAAFSSSICAERTACAKAISEGYTEFKEIAVVADQENGFTTPCGVCRQFLYEFANKDIPIYITKPAPCSVLCTSIMDLLPKAFKTYLT